MIELFIIYHLWGKVADRLYAKGYDKVIGYQLLFVAALFVGEFLGALFGILTGEGPPENGSTFVYYIFAIIGGAIGISLVFALIHILPKREIPGEKDFVWLRKR